MRIGTKSVLFGAHCFFVHPFVLAAAWWQLYGWKRIYIGYAPAYPNTWRWRLGFRGGPTFAALWDPRLWLVFFVHDLGYLGKPNMDGPEGETHPYPGALIASWICDPKFPRVWYRHLAPVPGEPLVKRWEVGRWGSLSLYHSRYLAKTLGHKPSPLCAADKLAIALTPAWLYLPMVRATGELQEYMAHAKHRVAGNTRVSGLEKAMVTSGDAEAWYAGVQSYCKRWAHEHKDGREDLWTSDARARATVNEHGVWQ